jgi:hypothetical protein
MKYVIFILAAILILGCTDSGEKPEDKSLIPKAPGENDTSVDKDCTLQHTFSTLEKGTFSEDEELVATMTCAGNKTLKLKVDGETMQTVKVDSDATTPVKFKVVGVEDGTLSVTIESDGEILFSRNWEVSVLGNTDTMGSTYDAFSHKEWLAMSFDIENEVEVGKVKAFLKRQDRRSAPGSEIILELRSDSGGEPGSLVTSKNLDITEVTMSENWITFDFDEKAKLSEGTYWVVLKVNQTEEISLVTDTVTLHYTIIDKFSEGNDYTSRMKLDVDLKTGEATETTWDDLPYDREYSIVLSYGK